jgi:hypothetical protein
MFVFGVWKENCSIWCMIVDVLMRTSNKQQNIVQLANVVGFKMVHVDYVVDLVMSHKELLSNADLI